MSGPTMSGTAKIYIPLRNMQATAAFLTFYTQNLSLQSYLILDMQAIHFWTLII
jgi:hypothetical protein